MTASKSSSWSTGSDPDSSQERSELRPVNAYGRMDWTAFIYRIAIGSSELVFPPADRGEYGDGIRCGAAALRGFDDGGRGAAEERIGRALLGNRRRSGGLVSLTRGGDRGGATG